MLYLSVVALVGYINLSDPEAGSMDKVFSFLAASRFVCFPFVDFWEICSAECHWYYTLVVDEKYIPCLTTAASLVEERRRVDKFVSLHVSFL